MVLDIVHHFVWLAHIARRLSAVGQVLQGQPLPIVARHPVVRQGPGQARANQISCLGTFPALCTIEPPLARYRGAHIIPVSRASRGIAQPIVEGGNATADQRQLGGLHKARPIGDLAKVPSLTDQGNETPCGLVDGLLQRLHGFARLMAHQVESKSIDRMVTHPQNRRIDHQLAHHPMLGGGVVATGGALHLPPQVQPVVVAGHDAVEHRTRILARGRHVVVDHVHPHTQAQAMQGHHHLAQLPDTDCGIARVRGEAALGRIEVPGVVAPVVTILRRRGLHRRLLFA